MGIIGIEDSLKSGAKALHDEPIFFTCSPQLHSEFIKCLGTRGEYKTKASFFRAMMVNYIKETNHG